MTTIQELSKTMKLLVIKQSKEKINSKEWLKLEKLLDETANEIYSIKYAGIK